MLFQCSNNEHPKRVQFSMDAHQMLINAKNSRKFQKKVSQNPQKIKVAVMRRPSEKGKRDFRGPLKGLEIPMLKNPGVDSPLGGRYKKLGH